MLHGKKAYSFQRKPKLNKTLFSFDSTTKSALLPVKSQLILNYSSYVQVVALLVLDGSNKENLFLIINICNLKKTKKQCMNNDITKC